MNSGSHHYLIFIGKINHSHLFLMATKLKIILKTKRRCLKISMLVARIHVMKLIYNSEDNLGFFYYCFSDGGSMYGFYF